MNEDTSDPTAEKGALAFRLFVVSGRERPKDKEGAGVDLMFVKMTCGARYLLVASSIERLGFWLLFFEL